MPSSAKMHSNGLFTKGVQRSTGSSWGLGAGTGGDGDLDVQRSMASLRSLMSQSERPRSRLAPLSSMAGSNYSRRGVRCLLACLPASSVLFSAESLSSNSRMKTAMVPIACLPARLCMHGMRHAALWLVSEPRHPLRQGILQASAEQNAAEARSRARTHSVETVVEDRATRKEAEAESKRLAAEPGEPACLDSAAHGQLSACQASYPQPWQAFCSLRVVVWMLVAAMLG